MSLNDLIQKLHSPDPVLQMEAAELMGNLQMPECIDPLLSGLSDSNSDVRYAVVKALGNYREKRVLSALVKCLKDPVWYIRVQVGIVLDRILIDKNQSSILNFLFENDPSPLSKLYSALGLIALNQDVEKNYLKFILNLFNDDNLVVKINAATILGDIQDYTILDYIFTRYDRLELEVKEAIIYSMSSYPCNKVVKWLSQRLNEEEQVLRAAAVKALGNLNNDLTLKPLIKALKDEHHYVRSNAVIALGNLRDENAIEPLIQRLKDSDQDVVSYTKQALEKIGI